LTLKSTDEGDEQARVYSTSFGQFAFGDLPAGTYEIATIDNPKAGVFAVEPVTVDLAEAENLMLRINLPVRRRAMILARLHGIEVEEIQAEKDGTNGYAAGDNPLGKIYEIVRPPDLHWDTLIKRHETAITRSIETLEKICEWLGGPWTYGNLAIVTALDYTSYVRRN